MSIKQKREKEIKSPQKDTFAWNEAIQKMQSLDHHRNETEEQKIEYDKRNIGNCKCLTKTPDWQHHQQYCPIWKNGRIAELESALDQIIYDYDLDESRFAELLKHSTKT